MTVQLLRGDACPPSEARRVANLLRAVAEPRDGLEHIYAQPSDTGAGLVLFLLADSRDSAVETTRALYRRASRAGLTGYRLGPCHADPRSPLIRGPFRPES